MPRIPKIPYVESQNRKNMNSEPQKKRCDDCGLFLEVSNFYKNKVKLDGFQNRCKDCMKDYKLGKRKKEEMERQIKRELYFIPDIYLVGYGRTQVYQNSCVLCEKPFFCLKKIRESEDLICMECEDEEFVIPERCISKVNYIGNVIGWIAKTECPVKQRRFRNYKKVFIRDRYTCQYCGYNLLCAKEFMELNIDHIKPWSAMGGNAMNNLVVACKECNLIASDKWFGNFEEKKEYILFEKQKRSFRKTKNLSDVNK